tara:strand:- start:486 stop:1007 length:522 start_codon:yes stop_codon:yes gene_type:complete
MFLSCFVPQQQASYTVKNISVVETFVVGPPTQKAAWKIEPTIRVCSSTKLSIHRIQKAVKYWEMLGYEFDGVRMDYNISCMHPNYGEIIVTLPEGNIDPEHIAATRIYTRTGTLNIAKAKIFIYPKEVRKQRVIEHELGHALGWMHYSQKYHIMHPLWHLGGFNASGLRKSVD